MQEKWQNVYHCSGNRIWCIPISYILVGTIPTGKLNWKEKSEIIVKLINDRSLMQWCRNWGGGAISGRSINPIPTGRGQIIPTYVLPLPPKNQFIKVPKDTCRQNWSQVFVDFTAQTYIKIRILCLWHVIRKAIWLVTNFRIFEIRIT